MAKSPTKLISALLAGTLVTGCVTGPGVLPSLADPGEQQAAQSTEAAETPADTASSDEAIADSKKKAKEAASRAIKAEKSKKSNGKTEADGKDADGKDAAGGKSSGAKGKKATSAQRKAAKAQAARQRQITRAVAYLNTLETQLETATEDLEQTKRERKKTAARAKKAKKAVSSSKHALAHAKRSLNTTAKEIYVNGDLSYLSVLFGANNFDDFASRLYLLESLVSQREREVMQSRGLKETYEAKVKAYQDDLAEVQELEATERERSKTINESIDSQLELIGKLDPAVLSAVNDIDSVKASRKWLAKYGGSKSKKGSHPEIVNIASQYLGVPYVWGGETPAGFDCSGLTMYCYAQIGIDLPHFARDQYDCGKHISREALMPGDLVFFGPDVEGIHHVGIYVGEGKYIQAPRTGDVVKVSSLADRSDYVGACRPGA